MTSMLTVRFCTTKGIGAYWALFTDVLDSVQLDRMVKELDNPCHIQPETPYSFFVSR